MKRNQYPDRIKNLIETCGKDRFSDPDNVIESSEEIRAFASENNDNSLSGYADFFTADAFFTKYNSAECMKHLKTAMKKLYEAGEWQQLGECYNLFGVLAEQHGIFSAAIDSYSEAISLCHRHDLTLLGAKVYANYSNLLLKNGDSENALKALLACFEYSERLGENEAYAYLRLRIRVNLAKLYVNLGKKEYAEREIDRIEGLYIENAGLSKEIDYYYLKLIYSDLAGNSDDKQTALKELIEAFLSCRYKVDYLDECLDMLEYFKQKGLYDLMKVVLPAFKKVAKSNDFLNAQIAISDYRIELLQHEGRWGSLLEEYRHYRELSIRHKKQLSAFLRLRSDIRRLSEQYRDSTVPFEGMNDSKMAGSESLMIIF